MTITVRAQQVSDLLYLTGGDSPYDDFGPRAIPTATRTADLDGAGGLSVVAADGSIAGSLSWHWVRWGPNDDSRCPMIGIWLRIDHRGQGVGTAAQSQLAQLFFTHTAVNRVQAHTDVANVAEQRALQKAGFTREGIIRGAQWRDGAFRDGLLYARLREDVPR